MSNDWQRRGPTDANRTRGRKWLAIRQRILKRDGFTCVRCPAQAEVVDHIKPLAKGGDDSDANLRSLCKPCHTAATAEQFGFKVKPTIGADGWPTTGR